MKKLILTSAALIAMTGSAFAQSATQDVTLSATVPGFCTIDGTNTGATRTATIPPTQISNGQITSTTALTLSGTDGVTVCNQNVKIQLRSLKKGLTADNILSTSGSFIRIIHYTATAATNGATETLDTASGPAANVFTTGASSSAGAFSGGALVITVAPQVTTPGSYLVPDTYSDTLTVQLTPVV